MEWFLSIGIEFFSFRIVTLSKGDVSAIPFAQSGSVCHFVDRTRGDEFSFVLSKRKKQDLKSKTNSRNVVKIRCP